MDIESKTKLRRRLLKGGLAGPAVFTLNTGTAWAQSVNCLQKNPQPGPPGGPPVEAPSRDFDTWMRKPVTTFSLGGPAATEMGARMNNRFMVGPNNQYMELVERRLRTVDGPMVGMVSRETNMYVGQRGLVQQKEETKWYLVAYGIDGTELSYTGSNFPSMAFIAASSGQMYPNQTACLASAAALSTISRRG